MAQRRTAARAKALHVVPIEEEPLPRERHLRAVDAWPTPDRSRGAEVIRIDTARSQRSASRPPVHQKEPAILSKWAVGLCVVMFLAALTSGQA